MEIKEAVKELDSIFYKYDIKDNKDALGYRNKFIEYVKNLEGKDLDLEYKKHELFYEFVNLQNKIGPEIDLLNNYTMVVASSNRKLGQDFTPISLTQLVPKMAVDCKTEYPIFYDCAGGTGSLVIAGYYKWLYEQKHFDDQFKAIIEIDEYDIYNCYCCVFNFITRGLNAIIRNKNTLTNEIYKVFIMTNEFTFNDNFKWFSDFKTIEGDDMYEY